MNPNEIKSALVLRGITATSIAASIGIKRPNVSQTIAGTKRTRHVQEAIAKAIGKPVEEVFPGNVTKEAA